MASGVHKEAIAAGKFTLVTLARPLPRHIDTLRVYIGSDGRPWVDNSPAADPTGIRSLALELMLSDPKPAIYLGRPCYHGGASLPPCESALWTSGRYSPAVVDALAIALKDIATRYELRELTLVGYSGGGTLALLVASRLDLPLELVVVTVAANLDPDAWTEFHGLLPLAGSLNPVDAVPAPAPFRQIHLLGTEDQRVPRQTIQRYVERHAGARLLEVEGFGHVCCWAEQWPGILADIATR